MPEPDGSDQFLWVECPVAPLWVKRFDRLGQHSYDSTKLFVRFIANGSSSTPIFDRYFSGIHLAKQKVYTIS